MHNVVTSSDSSDASNNDVNTLIDQHHNAGNSYSFMSNIYSRNYWNLDPQIQEIIQRVCERCFNSRILLTYCRLATVRDISSISSDHAHDYHTPHSVTHSQSSNEIYIPHQIADHHVANYNSNHDVSIPHASVRGGDVDQDDVSSPLVERAVPVLSAIVSITIRATIGRLLGSPAMC